MSYKCWCDENNWYNLQEKHLKEIDQAVEWGGNMVCMYVSIFTVHPVIQLVMGTSKIVIGKRQASGMMMRR